MMMRSAICAPLVASRLTTAPEKSSRLARACQDPAATYRVGRIMRCMTCKKDRSRILIRKTDEQKKAALQQQIAALKEKVRRIETREAESNVAPAIIG